MELGAVDNIQLTFPRQLFYPGSPVLIHGEQGMDMTLLISSLAQVMLNPECRTFIGYVKLFNPLTARIFTVFGYLGGGAKGFKRKHGRYPSLGPEL